jgi:hypothetical protein
MVSECTMVDSLEIDVILLEGILILYPPEVANI